MRLYTDEMIDRFNQFIDPVNLEEQKIIAYINLAQERVSQRIGYTVERKRTFPAVANQELYSLPSKLRKVISVRYDGAAVYGTNVRAIERMSESDRYTTGDSDICYVRDQKLGFYSCPEDAAPTCNLTAAISSTTATSFTAEDEVDGGDTVDNFTTRGVLKIDDEKIEYTTMTDSDDGDYTTFSGLTRGAEGTVAATHSDEAEVTLQNIEVVGEFEPSNFINKPWGGTLTVSSGGSVDAGLHYYYLTFYSTTLGMESLPYPLGDATTASTNLTVALAGLSISRDPDVDYKRIYRTKASGEVYYYVTQVANATTSASDTTADSDLSTLHTYPYSELYNDYHELIVDYALMVFFQRAGATDRYMILREEVERAIAEATFQEIDKRTITYSRMPNVCREEWV